MEPSIHYFKACVTLLLLGGLGMLHFMELQADPLPRQKEAMIAPQPIIPPPAAPAPTITPIPTAKPVLIAPARTRILFTGDITLGRCIAKRALRASSYTGNFNYPFEWVAEELRRADLTVGSLDGSLSDRSVPSKCSASMNLIGPTRMAEGLQFAGFGVITVATNHVKDCGSLGFDCDNLALFDTLDTLTAAGIQPVGAGKDLRAARAPVVVERNGIRFAFLGISQLEKRIWAGKNVPGVAPLSPEHLEQIKADIRAAEQSADVTIVLPHWGVEYAPMPVEQQRVWAQEFVNAGADLVIGNHPHIIQSTDVFNGKPVFYALGNFIFDQEQSFRRESVTAEVTFAGNQIESWRLRPVSINFYTFQAHWAQETEAEYILARAEK